MPPATLQIHQIDVGQGEAALIVYTPASAPGQQSPPQLVLIDGGHTTTGGGTIRRYMKSHGWDTIHKAIVTHYDNDHSEGIIALLKQDDIIVREVLYRDGADRRQDQGGDADAPLIPGVRVRRRPELFQSKPQQLTTLEAAIRTAEDREERRAEFANTPPPPPKSSRPVQDQPLILNEGVRQPGEPALTLEWMRPIVGRGNDENDNSLTMLLTYGNFTFYTAGDLTNEVQDTLAGELVKGNDGHVCAIKCGHHGARESTSPRFLKQTKAKLALISTGPNSYGHPHQETITALSSSPHIQRIKLTNSTVPRMGVPPRAAANEPPASGKVTVAGDDAHLGTVILAMTGDDANSPAHPVQIGHYTGGRFAWEEVRCDASSAPDYVSNYPRADHSQHQNKQILHGLATDPNDRWLNAANGLNVSQSDASPSSEPLDVDMEDADDSAEEEAYAEEAYAEDEPPEDEAMEDDNPKDEDYVEGGSKKGKATARRKGKGAASRRVAAASQRQGLSTQMQSLTVDPTDTLLASQTSTGDTPAATPGQDEAMTDVSTAQDPAAPQGFSIMPGPHQSQSNQQTVVRQRRRDRAKLHLKNVLGIRKR
ncbi:ComEC/Rec2 family competence protein [Chondromyces apiculatus]|uniref:FHA domain protein n=1 Tax=Chondromyces apiculatus DSM 436 TaxID=1192034 RepID=A0A017TG71_9BACT|nr:hypothetical protein [Chondromyces apiculatus]EYF08298.1 FHA domain protein [Chondromyces apiculatus DSM 436]